MFSRKSKSAQTEWLSMHMHIVVILRRLNVCQGPIRNVCNKTGGAYYLLCESKRIILEMFFM